MKHLIAILHSGQKAVNLYIIILIFPPSLGKKKKKLKHGM